MNIFQKLSERRSSPRGSLIDKGKLIGKRINPEQDFETSENQKDISKRRRSNFGLQLLEDGK